MQLIAGIIDRGSDMKVFFCPSYLWSSFLIQIIILSYSCHIHSISPQNPVYIRLTSLN